MDKLKLSDKIGIIAILIAFVTLGYVYVDHESKQESKEIIIQNLGDELNYNLGLIESLNNSQERFTASREMSLGRLEFYYLEKYRDISNNKSINNQISIIILNIKSSNRLMNLMEETKYPNPEIYYTLKKEHINELTIINEIIRNQTIELRKQI